MEHLSVHLWPMVVNSTCAISSLPKPKPKATDLNEIWWAQACSLQMAVILQFYQTHL